MAEFLYCEGHHDLLWRYINQNSIFTCFLPAIATLPENYRQSSYIFKQEIIIISLYPEKLKSSTLLCQQ
jgi:hypothetical protein